MYPTPESTPQPTFEPKASMPTNTLHHFTLLPPELRNIIWELSLPSPRVFDVYPASSTQTTPAQQGLRFVNQQTEPPPALASVCRESRSLALHHYRPLTLDGTTKYVDLSRDILMLESSLFERNLFRTLLFMGKIPLIRENLRSLAFGTSYGIHTGIWHPVLGWKTLTRNNMGRFLQRLAMFTRLEKLVFVVHQEVQLEVTELPPPPPVNCAWDGQVVRNATLYLRGTPPPPPRVIIGKEGLAGTNPRASPPADRQRRRSPEDDEDDNDDNDYDEDDDNHNNKTSCVESGPAVFYRVPWTSEKPWLPHVNELFYCPLGTVEDDEHSASRAPEASSSSPSPRCRDPIPTDADWLRFGRSFKRDLDTGLKLGLAEKIVKMGPCKNNNNSSSSSNNNNNNKKRKRDFESEEENGSELQSRRTRRIKTPTQQQQQFRELSIEGASLLWRYTLPTS